MELTFCNGEKTGNNILKINIIGEMVRNAKRKKQSKRVNVMGWEDLGERYKIQAGGRGVVVSRKASSLRR